MRVVALVVAATLTLTLTGPVGAASAKTRVMPGRFTGYAFDTCEAPSQRAMDDWRLGSKYAGVGVYIAGINRGCKTQRHLTRGWLQRQSRRGWHVLPLVVGLQASCNPRREYRHRRISADPRGGYAKARAQGRASAVRSATAARRLEIARGSVLWFDLEGFDIRRTHCRRSALSFVSAWTHKIRRLHYRAGLYSSASSGIVMVNRARRLAPKAFHLPRHLWIGEWNGRANLRSSYISTRYWWPHRRVHQYRGPHTERHLGSRINIDSNFLSVGGGSRAPRPDRHCGGVRLSFRSYPRLQRGDRGRYVRAVQCLLREKKGYRIKVSGTFGKPTARSVRRFRDERERLAPAGHVGLRTWTALLATGRTPVLKYGSASHAVRRLQRALNAASRAHLKVDGVFGRRDLEAVRHYQRGCHIKRTGVVTDAVWDRLKHGRTVRTRR